MKKHGFRSIFSLLLAVMMVCSMLPTAAFAQGNAEEQPVVVESVGAPAEELKQDEVKQPEGETPEEPKQPEGETPEEPKQPEDETPEEPKQPEGETSQGPAKPARAPSKAKSTSVPLTLRISSYGAPFKNGSTGKHNVNTYTWLQYISQSDVGSDNASGSAHAYFKGSNESGWQLWLKVEVGNYKYEAAQNAWVYNKDMSAATGDITYGLSFNSSGGTSTYISIGGAKDLPKPTTYTYVLNYDATGGTGAPSADSWSTTGAYHSFTVASTVPTRAGYTFKGWKGKANDGSDEIYTGGMACAVSQYGNDVVQNDNTWTRTLYAVWEENRPSAAWNEISKALGTQVYVQCVSDTENHAKQGYELRYESSAVGRVTGGYACNVYVYANGKPGLTSYVEEYNTTTYPNTNHVLDSDSDTGKRGFELRYDDGGNGWYIYKGDSVPIVFNVKCEAEEPSKPYKPGDDEVKNLLGDNAVQITCTNTQIGHDSKTFGLIDDTFIVYQSNNRCEVVINNFNPYVSAFDAAVSVPTRTHITDNSMAGQNKTKINLVWSDGRWTPADAPAKYHVLCTLQPAPSSPPTFDELVGILGAEAVKVVCTNAAAGHDEAAYALKRDTISNTSFSGGPNGHTYTFDINSAKYVAAYNETTGKTHTPGDAAAPVTLVWQNGGWKVQSGIPVVFNVACVSDPVVTYTVTYKDGANGTVFADDVHSGLKSGDATPDYEGGTPTRDGFTFQGWEPEVTGTVTGNATYTAKWKKNPAQPDGPSKEKVIEIYGNVTINCTTLHGSKSYPLTKDTIEIGSVTYREDIKGYTCMVYISSAPYVEKFDTEHGGVKHTVDFAKKGFEFNYLNGQWFAPSNDDGTIPIVFNVKCEEQQPQPYKPSDDEVKKLLGDDAVNVICTNEASGHGGKPYGLLDDTFEVRYDGQYGCEVIVTPAEYVRQFDIDREVGQGTHASDASKTNQSIINLKWVEGKWTAVDAPAKFYVLCVNEPPIEIPNPEVEKLLKVDVICTTSNNAHVDENAPYALIDGTYSTSAINNEGDVPTCTVTVSAEEYVKLFNSNIEKEHTLIDEDSKTITLRYVGNEWKAENDGYVDFKVKCKTQPEVPGDITDADLAKLKVVIHCTTNGSHTDRTYDLIAGTYRTDYSNDGGFTCYIAVLADLYVKKYVSDTGTNHELVDPQKSSKTITLRWNTQTKAWAADSNSVTFDVKCKTEEKPAYPNVSQLLGACVKIHCTNDAAKHEDKTYGLANFGVTQIECDAASGRYYFNVLLKATLTTEEGIPSYLDMYNKDIGKTHTLAPDEKVDRSIRVEYVDNKWVVASQVPVQYNVVCVSEPVVTYTVTYLDGANGKAFASQVYTGLKLGGTTPKFNGTPVRSGYVFIGWSPVWSGTVTGNVTYTATWSTITGGLDKVPKTGDSGLPLALSALLLFSFCGAAACVVSTKKRG